MSSLGGGGWLGLVERGELLLELEDDLISQAKESVESPAIFSYSVYLRGDEGEPLLGEVMITFKSKIFCMELVEGVL